MTIDGVQTDWPPLDEEEDTPKVSVAVGVSEDPVVTELRAGKGKRRAGRPKGSGTNTDKIGALTKRIAALEQSLTVVDGALEKLTSGLEALMSGDGTSSGPMPIGVGTVVHFRMPRGPSYGEARPAIAVRVDPDAPDGVLDLCVILDGVRDTAYVSHWPRIGRGVQPSNWHPIRAGCCNRIA